MYSLQLILQCCNSLCSSLYEKSLAVVEALASSISLVCCSFIAQSKLVCMAAGLAPFTACCHWKDGVIAFPGHLVGHVSSAAVSRLCWESKLPFAPSELSHAPCQLPVGQGLSGATYMTPHGYSQHNAISQGL